MKISIYEKLFNLNNIGYAYLKVASNHLKHKDAIFMQINDEFELIMEMKKDQVVGNRVSLVCQNDEKLLNIISNFLTTKKDVEYEYFLNTNNKIYRIRMVGVDRYYFFILLSENNQIDQLFFNNVRYQSIINNMNDVIWIMDFDYHMTYFSPSAEKVLGYTPEELLSFRLKQIIMPDSYDYARNILHDEIELERSGKGDPSRKFLLETSHRRKDGKVLVIEHVMQFLRDANQEAYSIMGIGRDITEWKEAKENLKKNKNQLQLILDSTGEGILGVDLKGNCTFCNSSSSGLLGYEQEELLGMNINNILYPTNNFLNVLEVAKDKTIKLFNDERGIFVEDEIFWRKDGSYFHAEYYSYPQYQDGDVVGAVVTFYDTTDRKMVEDELKESERSMSVLLSNLPGMAYRCDFDKDYTMHFVSEGCYKLTGYKPEELLYNSKLSFNEVIKLEYRDHLWKIWSELVVNKKVYFREEYKIITANGEEKWVLEQGQVIYDIDGNVEALEGLIIDVNEQKQKQEEVEYLSYHDGLTGLHNRIYFDKERIRLDQEKYLPLSLMVGDINGLKLLNDALGHYEGDQMLIKTGELLQSCITDGYILSRTSGDEFSILMPNTSEEDAYTILKKIQQAFYDYNNHISADIYKINLSLGFATKSSIDTPYTTIQKIAEDFMYKRKLLERSSSHSSIISSIKSTMYEKSQETEAHADRMQTLAKLIGMRINLTQMELDDLLLLATLHDIGKVGIDDKILRKPGKLNEEEWIAMKRHPEIGYRIAMASSELMSIANYILCHHERWDGTGYPQGLKGNDIPQLSRIIAIVDSYDAMTQDRPYRKALDKEIALKEIQNNAGTQFDPIAAEMFVDIMNEFNEF